ncbi:MAG: hypothetical protein ACK5SZ_00065, partial [bacterium]
LHDADLEDSIGKAFRRGGGCRQCHNSGFAGRCGVYEVFEVTPELRRMIHLGRPTHELRAKMRELGALSLREEGVALAMDGRTTLEEVLRVTQNDDEERNAPEAPVERREAA